jgi:hypothetical protein
MNNTIWITGLVLVITSTITSNHMLPHPWDTVIADIGILGSAVLGYLIQPHRDSTLRTRQEDKQVKV